MSKACVDPKLEDHPLTCLRSKSVDCHIHFHFGYPAIHELYTRILDSFFAYYGACSHQQREARISSVISALRFSWRQKSIKSSLADNHVRWIKNPSFRSATPSQSSGDMKWHHPDDGDGGGLRNVGFYNSSEAAFYLRRIFRICQICLSAQISAAPTGRLFIKTDRGGFMIIC
jgi:hypothetical protein